MSRNDAEDFAKRLYARLPADYRTHDEGRNQPLLALLRVIGTQVSNLRQDLDSLWDNFFIETCDDWVVPYVGALLGTNLLPHPVGQSDRLDVWNTIVWRRIKGTPRMLAALAAAISEWPTDMAEFFQQLGWSQNMNHLRLDAELMPDLRDRYRLSLLGCASDPWAHAGDFKTSHPLDQPRVRGNSLGIGRAAWGTPGRYQIDSLGFFVRRLQCFPVRGATPTAVDPGAPVPNTAFCFTFDPLHRDLPLFVERTQAPLTRAAFNHAPWETFGKDVAVRQFGVLLAEEVQPQPAFSASHVPFTFGTADAGLALRANDGIRLLQPEQFQLGAAHFVITAEWQQDDNTSVVLGQLSTLYESQAAAGAFEPGVATTTTGTLAISIQTGDASLGSWGPPTLPSSPAARFPGAVVAVRADRSGPLRISDGLYIYLPPVFLRPGDRISYFVADDGSSYSSPDLETTSLARAAEGQVYPQRASAASLQPALAFTALNRGPGGLRLPEPPRFGGAGVFIQAELFTGSFQPMGGIATIDQAASDYPLLHVPDSWPAFIFGPNLNAVTGDEIPGLLTILLKPLSGAQRFIPAAELIVTSRDGQSLLVYLPEIVNAPAAGVRVFVADDGSTYFVPADNAMQQDVLERNSFAGVVLARLARGQVLPIADQWPLQQRRPVAMNLCRCDRNSLLRAGEFGIDPELGRFAFAANDPAIGQAGLSVDYVEAFSDRVGALNFDRQIDPSRLATRVVSQSGDAGSSLSVVDNAPIYTSIAAALADAQDNDIIEIADSASYAESAPITLSDANVAHLTIRAADQQRPCLTFFSDVNTPTLASLVFSAPMEQLELNGLLISGGPVILQSSVRQLLVTACTLDPRTSSIGSLVSTAIDTGEPTTYLLCRCITGALRLGSSVTQLTVADSIIDQHGAFALAAPDHEGGTTPDPANVNVQLERVTVFGRIVCDVLSASECLLDDKAQVMDQQSGCMRFTRFEIGSVLPRRFRCIPTDEQAAAWPPSQRVMPPLFNSRQWGRPDYAQLGLAGLSVGAPGKFSDMSAQGKLRYSQFASLTASELGAEAGAFASALNAIRLNNLTTKLREFMPVGLSAVIIAET